MSISHENQSHYSGAYSQGIGKGGHQVGWLQTAITSIVEGYRVIKQRREDRAAFAQLAQFDESQLKDIGITKSDVVWASHLPLHVNASEELNKISRREGVTFL